MTTATGVQLRLDLEEFLYLEADLLDSWRLEEWLTLVSERGHWLVPSTDLPDGDPAEDLFLVHDDYFLLSHRVRGLLTKAAHAEFPHSRTRRLITNVLPLPGNDGLIRVAANFAVYRFKNQVSHCYVGSYRHLLEPGGECGFRFVERKTVLDHDALRPHGKLSFIL
jgi:p-cumate 2,3-dioxygenase beta subunit